MSWKRQCHTPLWADGSLEWFDGSEVRVIFIEQAVAKLTKIVEKNTWSFALFYGWSCRENWSHRESTNCRYLSHLCNLQCKGRIKSGEKEQAEDMKWCDVSRYASHFWVRHYWSLTVSLERQLLSSKSGEWNAYLPANKQEYALMMGGYRRF